ncbi:hypothetical protein C7W88_10160 [Novosphingobium sp. THN1]|uniref:hypothetical protein n=1 Tax=Novosphingobium sp. THN1 TaxID=1016987 RepID=UPI000E53AD10|nr:hypothetical protein [Novosphingobium sp. THN1]AXU19315.1 hypothetical protein C7W88_10160 [Novosphingobium sp. THN1]
MIPRTLSRIVALAMLATPLQVSAQEDDSMGEVIVTAQKRSERLPSVMTSLPYLDRRPAVGLRRTADGVVRRIEIGSDSRSEDMRRSEVQAMLLAALDRASRDGLSLVTGELEVKEVTRENWRTLFPALASPATTSDDEDDDDSYDDDEDEDEGNGKVQPGFEDDGSTATARLMIKAKLTGTIDDAQRKVSAFVKAVPATGRSEIRQLGTMALTIVNPEQYREEINARIARSALQAASPYGAGYGVEVTGLDRAIAWAQVSNTEVFLYIPYAFAVRK